MCHGRQRRNGQKSKTSELKWLGSLPGAPASAAVTNSIPAECLWSSLAQCAGSAVGSVRPSPTTRPAGTVCRSQRNVEARARRSQSGVIRAFGVQRYPTRILRLVDLGEAIRAGSPGNYPDRLALLSTCGTAPSRDLFSRCICFSTCGPNSVASTASTYTYLQRVDLHTRHSKLMGLTVCAFDSDERW